MLAEGLACLTTLTYKRILPVITPLESPVHSLRHGSHNRHGVVQSSRHAEHLRVSHRRITHPTDDANHCRAIQR